MTPDPSIIQSVLRRRIRTTYHFIPLPYISNVLFREGLWCRRQLSGWGDAFDDDMSKWGRADKARAFQDYVCCSVNPPMGMLKKKKRPVLILLHPYVLALPRVAFVGKWSSWGDVEPKRALGQTGIEWFEKMFLNTTSSRASHPGEFLVPSCVPLTYIRGFVFYNDNDKDSGIKLLEAVNARGEVHRLRLIVDASLFGTKMQEEDETT